MRACAGCGETSPDRFYASIRKWCRACWCAHVRRHRRTQEGPRLSDRKRNKTAKRKKHLAENAKQWRAKNPDKYKAQTALNNALRDGRVKREPCLFCGADHVHGHHTDYSKPLDVHWVCPRCHHRLHALERKAA
jgi:hypothetical protein